VRPAASARRTSAPGSGSRRVRGPLGNSASSDWASAAEFLGERSDLTRRQDSLVGVASQRLATRLLGRSSRWLARSGEGRVPCGAARKVSHCST
jgi:hypothetical protein